MPRALITGCSTGIGRATAVAMTQRGYDVVGTARRLESLAELDVASKLQLDVTDDASVRAAVELAGEVDVLVNNAAWGVVAPIETVPIDRMREMFETNVFGVIRMTQAVLPQMRERAFGTVVNVSSAAGRFVQPLNGPYSASKFALEGISEAMYYELGHFGIRVAIIEPGYIATAWSTNEVWAGREPPYEDLYRQVYQRDKAGVASAASPELVADAIIQAIETTEPTLRYPVASRVDEFLAFRATRGEVAFKRAMWEMMDLDW